MGDEELQVIGDNLTDFRNLDLPKDTEEILEGETFFKEKDCDHEWSMARERFISLKNTQYTECSNRSKILKVSVVI